MSLLSRYILAQIWIPALLASVVTSFMVIAGAIRQQLVALFRELPIAQVTLADISWISVYALPTLVGYIFPVTFLMGIMLAFGRMAQHGEITAMKAAGIPLKRAVLPVILTGAVLSAICFLAQDQGRPWAYRRMMQLVHSDLPLRVTLDMLPKGVMHEYGSWRVYIGGSDADGTLHNIVVLQPLADGNANALYADSARVTKENGATQLQIEHGYFIQPEENGVVPISTFERGTRLIPALSARDIPSERKMKTLRTLLSEHKTLTADYERTKADPLARELRKVRIEISDRLSFPLMCLAVSLVGAPIGARTRRAGRSFAFASGFVIIVLYFVFRKILEPSHLRILLATAALGQVPNLILAAAGAALIWRVDRV